MEKKARKEKYADCKPSEATNVDANMKQISNKEYERYQKYQIDRLYGRILTPDGLRLICAALDYDPEKIGKHMLEMLAKFRNDGIIE